MAGSECGAIANAGKSEGFGVVSFWRAAKRWLSCSRLSLRGCPKKRV